jgi:hypothetical protein
MKHLIIASALAVAATSVSAVDLGNGLSMGAEIDTNYVTGVDTWSLDATPYAAITQYGITLKAETTVDVLKINEDDVFKGVDLSAEYAWNGFTTYTEVSSDKDFEFGDITVGAKIKF